MNDLAADSGRSFAASPVGDSAVAVVTGGAAGIGEAIGRRLSADGFTVVIADLDRYRAEAVATEISARGGKALGRQVDVSAAESVAALFAWLTDELDRCDVLVNNAGVASTAPLAEVELERWNLTIAINVTAALLTTQHAVPLMKKGGRGRVVNISSISGVRASAGKDGLRNLQGRDDRAHETTGNRACGRQHHGQLRGPRSGGYRNGAGHSYRTHAGKLLTADTDEALWQAGGGRSRRVLPLLRGCVVYHRSHDSGRRWLSCGRGA
jgi:NAD(P)-dependent dehydrogenase (short-subunit alcohol dehydrogenase family)